MSYGFPCLPRERGIKERVYNRLCPPLRGRGLGSCVVGWFDPRSKRGNLGCQHTHTHTFTRTHTLHARTNTPNHPSRLFPYPHPPCSVAPNPRCTQAVSNFVNNNPTADPESPDTIAELRRLAQVHGVSEQATLARFQSLVRALGERCMHACMHVDAPAIDGHRARVLCHLPHAYLTEAPFPFTGAGRRAGSRPG